MPSTIVPEGVGVLQTRRFAFDPRLAPTRLAGMLLVAWTLCGCVRHAAQAALPPACTLVPDSVPLGWTISRDSVEALFAPENMVGAHPRRNGPYPRDLLVVGFRRGTSTAEKRATMERVGGCVVGGDGTFLYARVAGRGDAAPVWWAHDELMRLPQVVHVSVLPLHQWRSFTPPSAVGPPPGR